MDTFSMEREVRQGCPFVPYFFLIVGEVLTHVIKKVITERRKKTTKHIPIRKQFILCGRGRQKIYGRTSILTQSLQ